MTGAELKAARKKLGQSIAVAARRGAVSARTWCRWESGVQKIPEGAVKLFRLINGMEKE